jgi:hypothetical protein
LNTENFDGNLLRILDRLRIIRFYSQRLHSLRCGAEYLESRGDFLRRKVQQSREDRSARKFVRNPENEMPLRWAASTTTMKASKNMIWVLAVEVVLTSS